jgi:hypothetical protein
MHRSKSTSARNKRPISRISLLSAALAVVVALSAGCSPQEKSVTLFEDVTPASGLGEYVGMTYGAAWGDLNSDGLPDLYVTNHLNEARLYRNLGGGRFEDVTTTYFAHEDILADKHGCAWADYDNDGRLDLVQLTGAVRGVGSEPKLLFHNRGNRLVNVAAAAGVLNPEGRTRMPLWYDFNNDGRLDLFEGAEKRFDDVAPPFFFLQQDGRFAASDKVLRFAEPSAPFCVATQLTDDNHPALVCRLGGKHALQVFDASDMPARPLDLLPQTAFEDIAAGDFDNDGRLDLFLTRKNPPGPVAFSQPADKLIIADISIDKGNVDKPTDFSFRSKGTLSLRVASANPADALAPENIHIGQGGASPNGLAFDVSPTAPGIGGMAPNAPGKDKGVYIALTAPDQWEVHITAPRGALAAANPKYQQIQLRIASSEPITKLEAVGEAVQPEEAPSRLFMNRGDKLVEESDKRGVNTRLVAGMNAVAGDFDNDMHLDLFVVASGDIGKQENLLMLNRGNGHFDVVRAAGGAAGKLTGVGDSVTMVDFDGDGFLDLFVSNGGSMGRSLGLPSDGGGYRLYRNIGNGNHWIEFDLEGTTSNRDGIGAIVRVTAGGVTQMRLQDGGTHFRSQNHQRLHFGLAKNAQIEKITVQWPSGKAQELINVKSNQVLRIKEPVQSAHGAATQR